MGYPLETTLSPRMHHAAFKELGIDGVYIRMPVVEERLKEATLGLRALGFRGVNVTVPHKERIVEHLDDIAEEVKKVGAVNTILVEDDKLVGHNTDIHGFKESLTEYKIDIADKDLLIIGAGGAARACACVLHSMTPRRFIVTDTILERARVVSNLFDAEIVAHDKIEDIVPEMDVVINATPADLQEVTLPVMKRGAVYYDMNYKFRTLKREDIKIVNGLLMLVLQGASSFRLWTGKGAPIEVMKKAVGFKND